MSTTGDYMRAFEACLEIAEYAAAHRLAHEFWGHLGRRCVWCGSKGTRQQGLKGHVLHLGPVNDRLAFRFCGRCYPKASKIAKREWEAMIYGMGITYQVRRAK